MELRKGSAYRWLQSLDDPDLGFVVIDPLDFRSDYPVEAVERSAGFVGLHDEQGMAVLVIVTPGPPGTRPTANLVAPIAVGRSSHRGAQVILHETGLGSADPL